MTRTIEQLEQANDEAVRAREAALSARLQAATRGVTDAESDALQSDVDRTAAAAREAQSALSAALAAEAAGRCAVCGRAGHSALDLGSMGAVCPVNRRERAARS